MFKLKLTKQEIEEIIEFIEDVDKKRSIQIVGQVPVYNKVKSIYKIHLCKTRS